MRAIKEVLLEGGCIHYGVLEAQIMVVQDSLIVETDLKFPAFCDLRKERYIVEVDRLHTHSHFHGGDVRIYRIAPQKVEITEGDREVLRTLVSHWAENEGGLPGNVSYQMVFDLCDKFGIPHPQDVHDRLDQLQKLADQHQQ